MGLYEMGGLAALTAVAAIAAYLGHRYLSATPKARRHDRATRETDPDDIGAETLKALARNTPALAWREAADGTVLWSNPRAHQVSIGLPGPGALFPRDTLDEVARSGEARRIVTTLDHRTGPAQGYEVRGVPVGDGRAFLAIPVDQAADAERQMQNFMQTLTRTFSHLTTGLAVFDSDRRLALFNPALTDLTGLPVDFLAGRPTLGAVIDRLREQRMLPEPRDYATWRRQIVELESASRDGTYSETWSLADNRTYRVTGRPHPGGAMALLLEDISTEMALTRRFRKELEMGQSVLDGLDTALAVFSPAGELTMVNEAYEEMWGGSEADTLTVPTVTEMSRRWMARAASPVWGDIRSSVLHDRARETWSDDVVLPGGGTLVCRVVPLPGGATLISFRQASPGSAALSTPRKLRA